jgi:DoxX-like protein
MNTAMMTNVRTNSRAMVWTGWVLQLLVSLFLLFDSSIKVLKLDMAVKGTVQAGFSEAVVAPIGWTLLISLILYVIPRTAILGAILLTGYLGGAVATNVRLGMPFYFVLLPAIMGVMAWAGLYLRDDRLRAMIPSRRYD